MRRATLFVSLAVGVGSLVWGFASQGQASTARWLFLFGIAWAVAEWNRARWFASFGLLAGVAAAAYGLWLDLSAGWMLAGAVGALFAWDLSEFSHRVRLSDLDDDVRGLERRHLLRLTLVAGAGFAFALIGMFTSLKFSFEWTAFLALLAALGVTQLVSWMRRGGE
ncbi:MAG: hypothetical protein AB1750_04325 [Chloroflexota bacterium]